MKRTDLLRREREIRRARKKAERLEKGESEKTIGDYIKELNGLFFHDGVQIYNTQSDEKILELLEDVQDNVEEKDWDNVVRKAVKMSGVKDRDKAIKELKELMQD